MSKLNYLIIFGSLLLLSFNSIDFDEVEVNDAKMEYESELCSTPTFDEGYNDGFREGTRLGQLPDPTTYNALWQSYRDYPGNFPQNTQNHPYFRGKYLGIVDGWLNGQRLYYEKLKATPGLELPGDLCYDEKSYQWKSCLEIATKNQN